MNICYLSHILAPQTPTYGNAERGVGIKSLKSIKKGDSCNTFWIGIENHIGTHIDCPAHFFADGMRVTDYPAEFWLFCKPQVMSVKIQPGQILNREDLHAKIAPGSDLLLLQSGWDEWRDQDVYSLNNPGLHPDIGHWLRKDYPSVRAVGFDWISVSSYQHREIG